MRLIIVIVALVSLIGCEQKIQKNNNRQWFDLPKFIGELADNMTDRDPRVSKTFILNNISETLLHNATDTSFWRKELATLETINLNSAQIRDVIEFKGGAKDKLSNLLIDEYRIVGAKAYPLKKVRIYYLDQPMEIRQVEIDICSANLIADSEKSIKIWLNRYNKKLLVDSIKVSGKDKTLLQPIREYQSITKSIW